MLVGRAEPLAFLPAEILMGVTEEWDVVWGWGKGELGDEGVDVQENEGDWC